MELELQAPSILCRCKMQSRYFVGNAQPEHHSNVEDFYCQIYFETVDTVANSIVESFNENDYTMYANCEQVLLKGTLEGNLSHKMLTNCASSTQRLTLIHYEFSYGWQSSICVSGTVKTWLIHIIIKNKMIWSLIPEIMSLVKIVLVMSATNASS